MSREENLTDPKTLTKHLKGFMDLDYALATEVWDYLATTFEPKLAADAKMAAAFGQTAFEVFFGRAQTKCIKAVNDLPAVRRAVFQYNPTACTGDAFTMTVDAMAANKTKEAEEIFKCLVKNPHIKYGAIMKSLLERLFIEILKKSASKKIEMSKKLSALLQTYIAKIKTDERSMLEQRVREVI